MTALVIVIVVVAVIAVAAEARAASAKHESILAEQQRQGALAQRATAQDLRERADSLDPDTDVSD